MARCKSCGAEIVFIGTASGKQMPVNAKPIKFFADKDKGNELFVTGSGATVKGYRASDGDRTGYISHFATCPNANTHRRKKP